MKLDKQKFIQFSWRVTALHMIAYFIAGILSLLFFGYRELFSTGSLATLMRPTNSTLVAAGPSLQVILGFFLSVVLFPFRSVFLTQKKGWVYLFMLIIGLTIFAPQLPGPGSFEGLIYTTLPWQAHVVGLPEMFIYAILFSTGIFFWYKKPKRAWNIIAGICVCLIFLMSTLGMLASLGT
jgi:hypothetical protein